MKHEQRIGSVGQGHAANALRAAGIHMVEQIATPVKLLPARAKGTFKVIWGEAVSGDHRGILPDGRSVLAETKTILDRNLRYSDLREHQPGRLTEHHENNGINTARVSISCAGRYAGSREARALTLRQRKNCITYVYLLLARKDKTT